MKRRGFLGLGLAAGLLAPVASALSPRVRPGASAWPRSTEWDKLKRAVGGRLQAVTMPDLTDPAVHERLRNPYYIGDEPGLTQSSGWLDAWRSSPSAYVVAAESAADVAEAVRFARSRNLRLVVRGGGHSYLGASNAPDSLMVWTRRMNAVTVHEAFVPQGSREAPVPAVSLGAGTVWMDAYDAVTTKAGRYVQGGGCTTVGVAGLVQGGGFGSHSKGFGTVAASLLEAEVVTANGKIRIVNETREPDLFWAIKGGGGGTFGVVTRLTLATHPLPEDFGAARLNVKANSPEAFRKLIAQFVDLYAANLFNPHWGEQVQAGQDNRLQVQMLFQGLSVEDAKAPWRSLIDFVQQNPADYSGAETFAILALPARKFWDAGFLNANAPGSISMDDRPGSARDRFWWSGDGDQVGVFWYAYSSLWLPASLLKAENRARLVDAWFEASRHDSVAFHFNKGLAGAAPETLAAARNTAMNPDVTGAFALAIIASAGPPAFPGLPPPVLPYARFRRKKVGDAMEALRAAAPTGGCYVNECDFFEPDWQRAFWGSNYARLARIKHRHDPGGLFVVHHGVGSEIWSEDGFQPQR